MQIKAKHVQETNNLKQEVKLLREKVDKMENKFKSLFTEVQIDDQIKLVNQKRLMKKTLTQYKLLKSGITVRCAITGSKRKQH